MFTGDLSLSCLPKACSTQVHNAKVKVTHAVRAPNEASAEVAHNYSLSAVVCSNAFYKHRPGEHGEQVQYNNTLKLFNS